MPGEPLVSLPNRAYALPGEEPAMRTLLHRLNNQLGIILANAELLEAKLGEDGARTRAQQIVSSAVDAISTVRQIRLSSD